MIGLVLMVVMVVVLSWDSETLVLLECVDGEMVTCSGASFIVLLASLTSSSDKWFYP